MTRDTRRKKRASDPHGIEEALDVLDEGDLRQLIHELVQGLDGGTRDHAIDRIVDRAARKNAGWAPKGPTGEAIAKIVAFAGSASRAGWTDPETIDGFLRQGSAAFFRRDYETARRILGALLPPLSNGEIVVGQEELVEDALGIDVQDCAASHVASVYMTSAPDDRAEAVRAAIEDVSDLGVFWQPLREMERVAIEPLPDFRDFLPRWRSLIEASDRGDRGDRSSVWDSNEDHWLREVVERLEGNDGLARLARGTRRGPDLRAWCRELVAARDWKAALSAFEEAATITLDEKHWRVEFLEGAALAAQELGRKDLPRRIERAWRESPSLLGLQRWLGSARSKPRVRKMASEALGACPKEDRAQRALLHLVLGDHASAAEVLSKAPGLGWSREEHPGHLLFSLYPRLLGQSSISSSTRGSEMADLDEPDPGPSGRPDEPHLRAPAVHDIVKTAGIRRPLKDEDRAAVLAGLRTAAANRIARLTREKRSRYYDHAANLVAICADLDPSPATRAWVTRLRTRYRRYHALRRELGKRLDDAGATREPEVTDVRHL